ncbi:hypothetical protein HPB50_021833 [Hyalomma asiaticum]|uniref:Uncharacterized protein n=1 Tax=Hyalomma asiaticum TaxID=266040 RepID=A0ACB7TLA2_HYAAI|nr:hypothetical protein HPB50_021833 [Hyalomma asiaticum]
MTPQQFDYLLSLIRGDLMRNYVDTDYGYLYTFDEYVPEQPLSWARERPIEHRQPPEEARFNTSFSAVPTSDTRYQLTPPRPGVEPYQTPRRPQSNYYQVSRRASELYSRTPHAAIHAVIHLYATLAVFEGIFHVSVIALAADHAFRRTLPA